MSFETEITERDQREKYADLKRRRAELVSRVAQWVTDVDNLIAELPAGTKKGEAQSERSTFTAAVQAEVNGG